MQEWFAGRQFDWDGREITNECAYERVLQKAYKPMEADWAIIDSCCERTSSQERSPRTLSCIRIPNTQTQWEIRSAENESKWSEMTWFGFRWCSRNEMPKLWIIQNLNIISQIKWFYTPFSNLFAVSFILLPNPTTDHNKIEYLFVPIQFNNCHFKYDLFK